MKKRFLTVVLSVLIMFIGMLGLSACGNNNESNTPAVAVSSVSLDRTYMTLEIGDTAILQETISPSNATDKSVIWSSSDTSVATVSNGTITAKSAGTATITVKTGNGKTATCSVTVKEKTVLPTAIYLSKSSVELEENNVITLTTTILPSNATDKTVEWIVLDTSVATVSDGTVTAVGEGETTLIVTTSNGLTATCTITVKAPFVFEEYGSGYALTAYRGTATEVEVPATYKGKKVIAIGTNKQTEGFYNCVDIVKVTLPNTISEINYAAFARCYSLQSIEIPEGCVKIGSYAFNHCTSLKSITIPNSCKDGMGQYMLADCSSLEILKLPRIGDRLGHLFESAVYESTYEDEIWEEDMYDDVWEWYLHRSWVEIDGKQALYQEELPIRVLEDKWVSDLGGFYQPIRARFTCYYIPTTLHTVIITDADNYPEKAFAHWSGEVLFE